jgi:hypothetical protein
VRQIDEPAMPQVLTRERAAQELSISLTTLKQLIKSKQLATVLVGKRQMVPASEVMRLAKPALRKVKQPLRRAMTSAADEVSAVRELLKKL